MAGGGHVWRKRGGSYVAVEMATAADGTHPTGMHSCLFNVIILSQPSYLQVIGRIASVRTLVLEAPISAVTWALGDHVFPWTGSNCQLIDDTFFYQNHQPGHLYNYTCQRDASETLRPRRIDRNLLHDPVVPPGVGRNSSPGARNSSSAALTYLHIATNGLVNKIGQVLLNDAKIEQKSCPIEAQVSGNSDSRTMDEYPLYREVFVISQFWNGYYHVVIEQMSRLTPFICFLRSHPSVRIHMNIADEMMDVVGKYFDLINIDSTRIIRGVVRAQVIYLPAGTPCTNPALFNIRLLSLWLRHSIRTVPDSNQAIPGSTEPLRNFQGTSDRFQRSNSRFYRNNFTSNKTKTRFNKNYSQISK